MSQRPRLYLAARQEERRAGWPISVFVHGMLLAIVLLAKTPAGGPQQASPEEGVQVVFQSGQSAPVTTPPTQSPAEAPQVNLDVPDLAAPPVPPPTQESPEPAPRRVERPAKPRHRTATQSNPFAHMGLPNFAAMPRGPRFGAPHSRGLDLSMGPVVQGGRLVDMVPHISSDGADGDYREALSNYVEGHKFYPEQARSNGEEGTVVIRALITRDGTVKDVHLVETSQSRPLDLAWLSMFRGKHLPPFPDDMKEDEKEFTLSMTYELVYQ